MIVDDYKDDFNENNNYYSVLFKAGYPVQARELNTLQSMIQNQVGSVGNHLFKNGALISGASSSFVQYDYIKLIYNNNVKDLESFNVYNDKGVTATVIKAYQATTFEDAHLILMYTVTGTDQSSTFKSADILTFKKDNIELTGTVSTQQSGSDSVKVTGKSMMFIIDSGIFFYNNYFISVNSQSTMIDPYLIKDENGSIISNNVYRVGLDIVKDIITPDDNPSLLDPHYGSKNFGAPGADRLKIELSLAIRDYVDDGSSTDFITLARVRQNHKVEYKKEDTEYNEIMKELARRMFETYGNFAISPWKVTVLNEKKKDINDTKGWSINGDPSKYVCNITTGTGYVYGYRVDTIADTIVRGRRLGDIGSINNQSIYVNSTASALVSPTSNILIKPNDIITLYNTLNVKCATVIVHSIIPENNTYRLYYHSPVFENGTPIESTTKIVGPHGFTGTCSLNAFSSEYLNDVPNMIPTNIKNISGITNVKMTVRHMMYAILDESGNHTFNATDETYLNDGHHIITVNNVNTLINKSAVSITDKVININLPDHASKEITLYVNTIRSNMSTGIKTKEERTRIYTGGSLVSKAGWKNDLDFDVLSIDRVTILLPDQYEMDITNEYQLVKNKNKNTYSTDSITRNTFRNINDEDTIKVYYTAFDNGDGDFYTIGSYIDNNVPKYNGQSITDFIDFRVSENLPLIGSTIYFDGTYVMSRADLLLVNTTGNFYIKEGVPGQVAKLPSPDPESMALAGIFINEDEYHITTYLNRSYKAKDITRVAERISKLEDAVTLSLLEQETVNMSVRDVNGLDRYKNGFLVDNFKTFNASNVTHREYNASIDTTHGILRPQFRQNNIKLLIDQINTTNFKLIGNMAIKEYTDDLFIQNVFATQSLSINPYMIYNTIGRLTLSPNLDTWADDQHLPNLTTTIDSGTDALKDMADALKMTGTKYGSWADFNTSIVTDTNVASNTKVDVSKETLSTSIDKIKVRDTTTTTNTQTTTTTTTVKVESSRPIEETYISQKTQSYTVQDMVKDISIVPYIRSRTVQFFATNLKPNTRVYAYFDGTDVNIHCRSIQQIDQNTGDVIVNRNNSMFGTSTLISDQDGKITGEFRIPSNTFFTGEKKFVLTNDPNNTGNPDIETTRCESTYFAGGISQTKQSSTLNVITPTYGTVKSIENKSTSNVSRDVSVKTETKSSANTYEVDRPYTVAEVKEYFYKNHYLNNKECRIKDIRANFNGIQWGGVTGKPDMLVTQILAIKQRIDNIEGLVSNDATYKDRIDADWKKYSYITEALSNNVLELIKREFDGSTDPCSEYVESRDWKGSPDYKLYLTSYNEDESTKLIDRINKGANVNFNGGLVFNASKDPVAQGFKVDTPCFISKVDVFFANVDDKSDIWFEIRDMVNGYPNGTEYIAHVDVKGADIKQYESADGKKAYQVVFEVPIYVTPNKSYAFVVGGFSPDTKLYISKLGSKLIGADSILEKPPLPYTMFRSLNGETWNAEQFDTMKINIYRCVFDMAPSTIAFKNDRNDVINIKCDNNPIETQPNTNKVRVYARNHSLRANDRVIINFATDLYFRIEVSNNSIPQVGQPISSTTGNGYIKDVKTTTNINIYEVTIDALIGSFKMDQEFVCQTRKYEYRDLFLISNNGAKGADIIQNTVIGKFKYIPTEIPDNIGGSDIALFAKEHVVRNVDTIDSFIIEVEDTFKGSGRSGNNNVYVNNCNIKYDMFNISGQYLGYSSNEKWVNSIQSFNDVELPDIIFQPFTDNKLSNPAVILSMKNEIRILSNTGSSCNISATFNTTSPYVSPVINTDSFSITTISNRIEYITDEIYNIEPNAKNRFISERTGSGGIQSYKHITHTVLLENPARDMKIMFDTHMPSVSDIEVYIKVQKPGDTRTDDLIEWIKIDSFTKKHTTNNDNDYITYDLLLSKNWTGWLSSFEYNTYEVKLIGLSKNSCLPVLFKNVRTIAIT